MARITHATPASAVDLPQDRFRDASFARGAAVALLSKAGACISLAVDRLIHLIG
jgi:hypothetical protein